MMAEGAMIRLSAVEPVEGFKVRLALTDGTMKVVDLEPFLRGPVFQPLRENQALFRTVSVDPELGTLVWQNGADIDPDVLIHDLKPAWQESDSVTLG